MKTQAVYLPSPTEIAEAAKRIRSNWTDREKRVRQRVAKRRQAALSRTIVGAVARTSAA